MNGTETYEVGTRIVTTTDGARGVVLAQTNSFGHLGYRVQWDEPRFGQKVSCVGRKVAQRI